MQRIQIRAIVIVSVFSLLSTATAPLVGQDAEIDFAHDVVPILKAHCAECHTSGKAEGGFSFNTLRQLKQSGYLVPGRPDESRLVELIVSADPDDQMPPKDRSRLTDENVATLKRWIADGPAWEPGFRFGTTGYEPPLLPRDVELPAEEFPGQNPIDRILSQYRRDRNLPDLQPVDDAVFLRRAWLDLVGLLPTVDQQLAFASVSADQRRSHLVVDLLNHDREYAEHWMTFWNDLLRNDYAGTGFIDGGRTQISAWLYQALLNNTPYDRFVRELVTPNPAAAGFINGIKWRGSVNASQVREIQFAQNVSQVFLGINMKCASCHDSFIDRWTLDEAYGLAAVYSTRELEIHRCDKGTGAIARAAWIFPELGEIDADAEQPERLKQLAELLTSPQNGRFARTIVNRLWQRLMGRGIVHPVDAMHTEPWSSDLLDWLAGDFVRHGYDLKHTLKQIATSQAYQSLPAAAQDSAVSEEFVFLGPQARFLTAEQFLDAVHQLGSIATPRISAPIPPRVYFGDDLPQLALQGRWIWSSEKAVEMPAGQVVAFRRRFEVPDARRSVALVATCDNEYTAYLNGRKLGGDANWQTIETFDLTGHLRAGENDLLVIGKNLGDKPNAAGLYAELILKTADQPDVRIATDESWMVHESVKDPKTAAEVDQALVAQAEHAQNEAEKKTTDAPGTDSAAEVSTDSSSAGSSSDQPLPGESDKPAPDSQPKPDPVPPWRSAVVVDAQQIWQSASVDLETDIAVALMPGIRPSRSALLKSNLLMRSLGRPNREQVVTTRPATLSTLQAIDLENGEILDNLLATAARHRLKLAATPEQLVDSIVQDALCRPPTPEECQQLVAVLAPNPTEESVHDLLWLVLMLPEFQFVQ
ncbi:MAG: DUF1549 domain-containing protein [Planctomycetaceae bacterium]